MVDGPRSDNRTGSTEGGNRKRDPLFLRPGSARRPRNAFSALARIFDRLRDLRPELRQPGNQGSGQPKAVSCHQEGRTGRGTTGPGDHGRTPGSEHNERKTEPGTPKPDARNPGRRNQGDKKRRTHRTELHTKSASKI